MKSGGRFLVEVATERKEVKTSANVLIAFFHRLKLSNDQAIFFFFPVQRCDLQWKRNF